MEKKCQELFAVGIICLCSWLYGFLIRTIFGIAYVNIFIDFIMGAGGLFTVGLVVYLLELFSKK